MRVAGDAARRVREAPLFEVVCLLCRCWSVRLNAAAAVAAHGQHLALPARPPPPTSTPRERLHTTTTHHLPSLGSHSAAHPAVSDSGRSMSSTRRMSLPSFCAAPRRQGVRRAQKSNNEGVLERESLSRRPGAVLSAPAMCGHAAPAPPPNSHHVDAEQLGRRHHLWSQLSNSRGRHFWLGHLSFCFYQQKERLARAGERASSRSLPARCVCACE